MVLRQSWRMIAGRPCSPRRASPPRFLVHGTITLLGVGVVVGQSLLVFNILKWLGAAYPGVAGG